MIKNDLKLHLQDDGSADCGPISTLMVLDHFGITDDRREVLKKVERSEFGTSTFANALVLKEYGLETQLVTIQPKIFDGEFVATGPDQGQILERVKAQQEAEKIADKKHNLGMLVRYLEDGGDFQLAIPTKETIVAALEAGKLVWISIYARALGKNEGGYHFVVVAGYKDDKFLIYNPWPRSRQRSWEDADKVMFAIHSVTDFDYDNGAIIVVGKKPTS